MVDTNILLGGGVAVGGIVAGIGLVAFAENSEFLDSWRIA